MKYEVKDMPNSVKKIKITIENEDLEKSRKRVFQKLNQEVTVPGFRKNEAPLDILQKHIGAEKFEMEVQNDVITNSYLKTLQTAKIIPLAHPKLKVLKSSPLEFEAEVEVRPSIDLKDYQKDSVKIKESKISKKEIDDFLETLRNQVAEFKEVKRISKKGDRVYIDMEGYDPKTKETIPNTKANDFAILIGEKKLVPGFEEELIGLKTGDNKEFEIKFPENYHEKSMANNTYLFKIKVNKVEEKILPELNDDLVKKVLGKEDKLEVLIQEIEKSLKIKKEQENRVKAEHEFLEKLNKKIDFEIPEILINEEIDFLLDNIKMQGLQRGLPWEKYLESMKKTEEDFKKELKPDAQKRVKYRLIIQEIIDKEKISIDPKILKQETDRLFLKLKPEDQEKRRKDYQEGGRKYLEIENQLQVGKVFEKYLKNEETNKKQA